MFKTSILQSHQRNHTKRSNFQCKVLPSTLVSGKKSLIEKFNPLHLFQLKYLLDPGLIKGKIQRRGFGLFFPSNLCILKPLNLYTTGGTSNAPLEKYLEVSFDLGRLQKGCFVNFLVQCVWNVRSKKAKCEIFAIFNRFDSVFVLLIFFLRLMSHFSIVNPSKSPNPILKYGKGRVQKNPSKYGLFPKGGGGRGGRPQSPYF